MPSTARTKAPQKAGTHPYTTKPVTIFDASRIIPALMNSRKSPRERMAKGKVMSFKNESKCRIQDADDECGNDGRLHIIHIESRYKIRHYHQRNRA